MKPWNKVKYKTRRRRNIHCCLSISARYVSLYRIRLHSISVRIYGFYNNWIDPRLLQSSSFCWTGPLEAGDAVVTPFPSRLEARQFKENTEVLKSEACSFNLWQAWGYLTVFPALTHSQDARFLSAGLHGLSNRWLDQCAPRASCAI